jgi:integrase
VRACLATAVEDGFIRTNPAQRVRLPHRAKPEDEDGEQVRPFTREQLAAVLELVHPRHRLMFRLLAGTGLRVSELLALQWRHLKLDGATPCVRVRRAYVRGRIEPPKSKHGKREVPLERTLVDELRAWRRATEWPDDEDLVFPSLRGTPLKVENVRRRVLAPFAEEVGAQWAGFHTFRHTCASMLFDRGANAKQVQRWLGHHSPSFTLDTYVHLLEDDLGEPLSMAEDMSSLDSVSVPAS